MCLSVPADLGSSSVRAGLQSLEASGQLEGEFDMFALTRAALWLTNGKSEWPRAQPVPCSLGCSLSGQSRSGSLNPAAWHTTWKGAQPPALLGMAELLSSRSVPCGLDTLQPRGRLGAPWAGLGEGRVPCALMNHRMPESYII